MKFILISDVHVDITPWDISYFDNRSSDCNTIVVAGDVSNDIWTTSKWIADLKNDWENVIWVPGNHDYYNSHFHKTRIFNPSIEAEYPFPQFQHEIKNHYDKWSTNNGIVCLNRKSVTIDGVNFIGATGWHDFVAGEPFSKDQQIDAWFNKSADRLIKWSDQDKDWQQVEDTATGDAEFIRNAVKDTNEPCVVITHHLPHRLLSYARPYDQTWTKLHGMFVNTKCEDINNSNIKYWCYGHTHFRSMREINGITYVCNPIGYPGENSKWSMVELEI